MKDPRSVGGGDADLGESDLKFALDARRTFLNEQFSPHRLQEDNSLSYRVYSDLRRVAKCGGFDKTWEWITTAVTVFVETTVTESIAGEIDPQNSAHDPQPEPPEPQKRSYTTGDKDLKTPEVKEQPDPNRGAFGRCFNGWRFSAAVGNLFSATGRLVATTYGSSSSNGDYSGYDEMGRVIRHVQQTDGVNYLSEATYYLNSALATETYPAVPGASDRRTVSYSLDSAARLSSLSSGATSYAAAASLSSISYKPQGALESETPGNSLIHQLSYNTRLQTSAIKLGTSVNPTSILNLTYDYGTTDNNGNVKSHVNTIGSLAITDTFSYDSLNRISSTVETTTSGTGWTENNGYDRYGNRWIDLGGGNQNLYFSTTTNKITTSGYTYDAAGNLTSDGVTVYAYDAENHLLSLNSTSAYKYDGAGRRVRKLVGENTRFIYGIGGELVAEYNGSSGNLTKEYVSGGEMMAVIDPSLGTRYTTTDHLGSPRVVTMRREAWSVGMTIKHSGPKLVQP